MVIEDEADIRQLLRTVLERVDYSVSEASEGLDGVRMYHQTLPDVVVLDVNPRVRRHYRTGQDERPIALRQGRPLRQ